MVVYGGAVGGIERLCNTFIGGTFAPEDLYLLNMAKGEASASWIVIKTDGQSPGKRYGHTISYIRPYLVVFGGHTPAGPANDTWVLLIEQTPFKWQKIESKEEFPQPRVYHSASVWCSAKSAGMVVIFGGRANDQSTLNDTWGLRKHRDGAWEWVKAPYSGSVVPAPRFQVCVITPYTSSTPPLLLATLIS